MNIRFGAGPPAPVRPGWLQRELDAICQGLTTVLAAALLIFGGIL